MLAAVIVTSNVPEERAFIRTDYAALLGEDAAVRDNAGIMAIRFFDTLGARQIWLAGYDGYHYDSAENYASGDLTLHTRKKALDAMNQGMQRELNAFTGEIDIRYLTPSRFERGE